MENKEFTPIAMKCNEAQFKEVEPILKENGLNLKYVEIFESRLYLTNCYNGIALIISNITEEAKAYNNRKVYEEWDKETFLKSCGIEETKVYTCKDLSDGRVACVNDGTIKELDKVLKYCFHLRTCNTSASFKYYFKLPKVKDDWTCKDITNLPTQSVKVFLKEIEIEEVRLKAAKGVNIIHESKSVNDLQLESLKREKEIADHLDKLEETSLNYSDTIPKSLNDMFKSKKPEPKQKDPLEETPPHKPDFSHLKEKVDKDGFTDFKNLFAFRRLEKEEIESSAFYSSIFKKDDLDKLVTEGVFIDKLSGQKYTLEKPKLYSILLTYRPTNIRIVFIDQTEEEIKELKEHYSEYHSIVVEQDQNKGILIQVKC